MGNLDRAGNTAMFFFLIILEEVKETIFDFPRATVRVF